MPENSVRPFEIKVPDSVLTDLHERLERTRWATSVAGGDWKYGADITYIRSLCDYWKDQYDWRAQERLLNAYPQFLCEAGGVDLHFWHIRGKGANPFPLLLMHGWPGSAYEFFEMIEPLSETFDLVIPDLPGFGFGGIPKEAGWGAARVANAFHTLMTEKLGYERYGTQGGDWGAMISARLGACYPKQVAGIHINFVFLPTIPVSGLPPEDMRRVQEQIEFDKHEGAYHLVHETKPDSLTIGQSDSPAGLAAWITEKFRTWSDCGGEIERKFSKDALLTNLMFYWANNASASAARLYFESHADPALNFGAPDPKITVPTAVAHFPFDPFNNPRSWAEKHFNIVRWTDMPSGGHFPAMEEPELLARDVREFYETLR
ncbi:MAG: epoxide hydrolase [Clostridiales Family XIII bacterium]|jgi:microsomal epoxide hydrolase|nr:epoxide hydrolase [Clostridiales Family XIII bacterium]